MAERANKLTASFEDFCKTRKPVPTIVSKNSPGGKPAEVKRKAPGSTLGAARKPMRKVGAVGKRHQATDKSVKEQALERDGILCKPCRLFAKTAAERKKAPPGVLCHIYPKNTHKSKGTRDNADCVYIGCPKCNGDQADGKLGAWLEEDGGELFQVFERTIDGKVVTKRERI